MEMVETPARGAMITRAQTETHAVVPDDAGAQSVTGGSWQPARNRAQIAGFSGRAAEGAARFQTGCAAMSAPMYMLDEEDILKRVFGLNMARARELAGNMTQETLAERLGVDRRIINRWERGGREPRRPMRKRIADELGQPLDFFYDEIVLEKQP